MIARTCCALIVLILAVSAFGEAAKKPGSATLTVTEGATTDFSFNPKEITIDKKNAWDGKTGAPSDQLELRFAGSESATLTFDHEFDRSSEKGNVYLLDVLPLERLITADDKLKRPPMVLFLWGARLPAFKGVIESIGARYTMFSPDGTPTRATVNVRLRESPGALGRGECRTAADCSCGSTCSDPDGNGRGECVHP